MSKLGRSVRIARSGALLLMALWSAGCAGDMGSATSDSGVAPPFPMAQPTDRGGSTGSLLPPTANTVVAAPAVAALPQADAVDTLRLPDEPAPVPTTETILLNPYVETASDPFSTFAADVDTASYDLFRSTLQNAGTLPPIESVRTEEFVNYFDYDYPAPSGESEHPFQIDVAASSDFFDTPRTLVRVGIAAQQPVAFEKKRANVAFLVDTSGSMQDPLKLPLVKVLLNETLELLEEGDRISVVTYGGSTGVLLDSVDASNQTTIRTAIDALGANGSTNGAAGIQLAYDQVAANFVEGGINHVILCTDGDFNVGVSDTQGLVDLIERERKRGITFTAVGFGLSPNDTMMEAISNKGNGVYGVIGSEADAASYARERLLSSLQLVAKDLKIQVEFNPEYVYAYRLVGYENRALQDTEFRDDLIDAGEVGAGHRVTALYELALSQTQLPSGVNAEPGEVSEEPRQIGEDELVLVKVRYKDLDAAETDEAFEVRSALGVGEITEADLDLKWAGAVADFAELLRRSPLVSPSLLDQIEATIEAQVDRDEERAEFVELFFRARPMIEGR